MCERNSRIEHINLHVFGLHLTIYWKDITHVCGGVGVWVCGGMGVGGWVWGCVFVLGCVCVCGVGVGVCGCVCGGVWGGCVCVCVGVGVCVCV